VALLGAALALSACSGHGGFVRASPGAKASDRFVVEQREVRFSLPSGEPIALGADLYRPSHGARAPAVLIVPGAGRASRAGVQPGDGFTTYASPVDVSARWAEVLAARGLVVLTLDKRTCSSKDDRRCRKNPAHDLDAEGPRALARDVDAACALLLEERGVDNIVLFAHGQGAQVALASRCASQAAALVLVAPIPQRVDKVLVNNLLHRERLARDRSPGTKDKEAARALADEAAALKNRAASSEAMFSSMAKGQFTDDAVVLGATLAFWRGWMELTAKTEALLLAPRAPRLLVLGSDDAQYAPADQNRIAAWGQQPGVRVLVRQGADHHLLREGSLHADDAEAVSAALLELLFEAGAGAL
jgi:pimeloyl-ACP methyl ester carboxylesterase